jgi:hypothetical protein
VYDVDAGRVAEATARSHDRSIFYALLPEGGDVGVRDGAFDFVLVPDLSLFADPAAIVALVRRVVSPLGAALISSPNADAKAPLLRVTASRKALGYYELYETIAAQFESVRMIGQAPFVGYAVAELSVEDPEPTIDSSLAESEGKEPDWFLALASDRNLRLEPFALIELPVHHFSAASLSETDQDVVASTPPEGAPSLAGTGTVLINILEAEREAALDSLRQQEQALQAERFRADRAAQELAAAREEIELLRERCRALGDRISEGEARRDALESRLEQEMARHSSVERRLEEAAGQRAVVESRLAEEAALRSALESHLEQARHDPELAALRERLRSTEERFHGLEGALRAAATEREGEVERLETLLRERGREIQDLRAEVDRRDKLVRELVLTNFPPVGSVTSPIGAPVDLSARLDRLANDAARREADLVGARWRIAQLERELTQQR